MGEFSEKQIRVFGYIRVSSTSQKEAATQENQRYALDRFLKERSNVVLVSRNERQRYFEDLAISGSKDKTVERKAFEELRDRIDEVDGVLIWDRTRLTRSQEGE